MKQGDDEDEDEDDDDDGDDDDDITCVVWCKFNVAQYSLTL